MKLPNINSHGFTLVELMVVIVVIAILSVVSYGIFNGVQGSARDSRRQIEIDQLAKNIESSRQPTGTNVGEYVYTAAMGNADYPVGLQDPKSGNVYCYGVAATSTPPAVPANFSTACAGTAPKQIGGAAGAFTVSVDATAGINDLADGDVKGWIVCAGSERGSAPICVTNLLR